MRAQCPDLWGLQTEHLPITCITTPYLITRPTHPSPNLCILYNAIPQPLLICNYLNHFITLWLYCITCIAFPRLYYPHHHCNPILHYNPILHCKTNTPSTNSHHHCSFATTWIALSHYPHCNTILNSKTNIQTTNFANQVLDKQMSISRFAMQPFQERNAPTKIMDIDIHEWPSWPQSGSDYKDFHDELMGLPWDDLPTASRHWKLRQIIWFIESWPDILNLPLGLCQQQRNPQHYTGWVLAYEIWYSGFTNNCYQWEVAPHHGHYWPGINSSHPGQDSMVIFTNTKAFNYLVSDWRDLVWLHLQTIHSKTLPHCLKWWSIVEATWHPQLFPSRKSTRWVIFLSPWDWKIHHVLSLWIDV